MRIVSVCVRAVALPFVFASVLFFLLLLLLLFILSTGDYILFHTYCPNEVRRHAIVLRAHDSGCCCYCNCNKDDDDQN